ncbi:flagellar protein FlgN [Azoarcus sp. TTM-91]|uniref:flagella synthesis protein FlgN n=1 Tax=Azoarcus sp. TTM-91 TaxID=2691581 RepID=UPI00145CB73B|nr:flagellar protein FlgN [Azoarcus sp. TTM-91]NMG33163.1 flagellar protein FlgN [Azoarcus sp. TTM-91]
MPAPVPAPTPADIQRLALLIEAEAIQLREFIGVLEKETALLIAADIDALMTLTKDKTDRYRQLQRLHDDRAMLLGRMGRSHSDASIRELCKNLPRVLGRWEEVLTLARDARERNQLTGKLIHERMQHNQTALSVLLAAADQPQLYDAAGNARPTGGGRMLGSA